MSYACDFLTFKYQTLKSVNEFGFNFVIFISYRLKHKYKSVDNATNLGYIVSPICSFSHEPMSIKLTIHTKNQAEALKFTCDSK